MRSARLLACLVVLSISACGGDSSTTDSGSTADAPPGTPDATPGPDAPPGSPDAAVGCTPVAGTPALALEEVASGFDMPIYVGSPPGDPRLFVVEKTGGIWIVDNGTVLGTPFLTIDVANVVSLDDERGLLGLAFHPDYATNRRFYTFYMSNSSDHVVSEWEASAANPNLADASSETQVYFLDDFAGNHNGGMIAFGPNDGYLYIGIGDGGGAGDTGNHGQNLDSFFGKMLRVDVSTLPYTIPGNNPFVGATGLDEIWAWGLRNPWRWSFDRETGDLYIGDVGQNAWEEVSVQPATSSGGENYGWRQMEGAHCYNPPAGCNMMNKVLPVYEYDHGDGCTVVGGYVYRGCRMPGHHGTYFLADYCGSWVRSFRWNGAGGITDLQEWNDLAGGDIVSFGEDMNGELYIVRQNTGQIMRIIPQ